MNYVLGIAFMLATVYALRRAGYTWLGALAGGLVSTVTALIAGVAIAQAVGFEHPGMGFVIVFAAAYVAFVGLTYRT